MEILSAPRGTGKTTKLVYELLDNPASVLVVSTHQRKTSMRVIVRSVLQRVDRPNPQDEDEIMERVITCDDIHRLDVSGIRIGLPRRVLVDDLEDVLYYFLGADVAVATVSVR